MLWLVSLRVTNGTALGRWNKSYVSSIAYRFKKLLTSRMVSFILVLLLHASLCKKGLTFISQTRRVLPLYKFAPNHQRSLLKYYSLLRNTLG